VKKEVTGKGKGAGKWDGKGKRERGKGFVGVVWGTEMFPSNTKSP
jgi:hypothetical protein